MTRSVAMALLLAIAAIDAAAAQARVPSGAMPGRERQQLGDPLRQPVPRIELRDGRPAPVVQTRPAKRPVKRKNRCRGSRF